MNNHERQSLIVTGEDADIVSHLYVLKDAIQRKNDAASPQFSHPVTIFHEYKHDQPTDLELARLYIHRQHMRTRNGSVYLYNGKYYKKLSDDQLKSQILSVLRDELEIKGNSKQLDTVAAAIKAEPTIQVNDEKLPVGRLCLRNCVIDIASMTCADHTPKLFFITITT